MRTVDCTVYPPISGPLIREGSSVSDNLSRRRSVSVREFYPLRGDTLSETGICCNRHHPLRGGVHFTVKALEKPSHMTVDSLQVTVLVSDGLKALCEKSILQETKSWK
jgi:hypothetical protein